MKTLLLLRHAKSSWDTDAADHDRPLNERGLRDAPRVGHLIREQNLLPDLILSSTALRARQTTEHMIQSSGYAGPVAYARDLYHAEPREIIDVLRIVDDAVERLVIVAHNPGLEEFVERLSGRFERMPTAALAHLQAPLDSWRHLALDGSAKLLHVWRPKEL